MKIYPLLIALMVASCGGGGGNTALVTTPATPVVPVAVDPLAPQGLIDLTLAAGLFEVDPTGITDNGGGGGGDSGAGGGAGDGSALRRATVVLTDSTGKTLSGITDDKGNYLIKFKAADFKEPFVLKVIDAAGNTLASPSELAIPAGKVARVNINPLTDKIMSDVLSASVKGTDKGYNGSAIDVGSLAQAKADLLTSIKAALSTAGVTSTSQFDPVRSVYKYDGTGVDTVIESISHNRDPGNGTTQLRAKLAPLVTNADGTIVPALISSSSPLATPQVALASNPAMTFTKITNWVNFLNGCLKDAPTFASSACGTVNLLATVSAGYKNNSKDFQEDFSTLFSDPGPTPIFGTELRNPNILFTSRYNGSTVDDLVVVEITIRQPRVGTACSSGCGGIFQTNSPVEYTQNLIFKRDDVTPGLKATNWVLYGNQRNFDWGVSPRYFTSVQQNPAKQADISGGSPARTTSGARLRFSPSVFNTSSRTYVASDVYAIRLKGPGLPAAGVVYAPTSSSPGAGFAILNKNGSIPTPGATTTRIQTDYRMSSVIYPSGVAQSTTTWPGTSGTNPVYATTTSEVDFSSLQAFNQYTAEFYTNANGTTPIVETSRILAPIEQPASYVKRPLHDLSSSLAQITPPQGSVSTVFPSWVRNSLATRIESSFFGYSPVGGASQFSYGANVTDAFSLIPSSTTNIVTVSPNAPSMSTTPNSGEYREIGITGTAARASFQQSVIWQN